MIRLLVIAALLASAASAHEGPRIWLGIDRGSVTTFGSDNDLDPTVYTPQRVFHSEFESLFGIQTTEFPGFEVRQFGGNVPSDTTFAFDLAGPALYYDQSSDAFVSVAAQFGATAPQLALSLGADLLVTGSGPIEGFDFFTFYEIGDHSHLSFTLLGDGVSPINGPEGVYAISLTFSAASFGGSLPIFLLIGNGVEHDDPLFESAIAAADRLVVDCVGDLNGDQTVDLTDLATLLANFGVGSGAGPAMGDVDGDGDVDLTDLAMLLAKFGTGCG